MAGRGGPIPRHEYWSLFSIYVPIAAAVFGIVLLLILGAVLRFRGRQHAARWHTNSPLEGGYAVLLLLISAFLMYLTFSHEHRVDTVSPSTPPPGC